VIDAEFFEWETLLAADQGRLPNTNKPSTQDQNEQITGFSY